MDDLELYKLCEVASPIAMRLQPVQNFADIRPALGQFTHPEIDEMEMAWRWNGDKT